MTTEKTLLEKVCDHALEKFAGDKVAAEDFVMSFIKEASSFGNARMASGGYRDSDERSLGAKFTGELMGGLGKGIGGLVVAGGTAVLGGMYNSSKNSMLHTKFLQALETAIATTPLLKNEKRDKVMSYAETIFTFAPTLATDANVLAQVLSNAVHGMGVDPATIKALTDIEGKHKQNSVFETKSYVK